MLLIGRPPFVVAWPRFVDGVHSLEASASKCGMPGCEWFWFALLTISHVHVYL